MSSSPSRMSWPTARLSDVCDVVNGFGFPVYLQGRTDLPFPFVKVSDMNAPGASEVVSSAANTVDDAVLSALGAHVYPPGTVIFPKVGGALLTNKKRILGRTSCFDNNVMGLVPKGIDSRFLFLWFRTVDLRGLSNTQALPSIRQSAVAALKLPLPPLAQQQRIVAKLDEQMATVDRAEKALAEQQAAALVFKRATLQAALDQAIHPEWECATLMDLCTFANGLWTGKKPPFQQASVIRNTNFTRDCTLDFSDIAHLDVEERQLRSRRLRTGDIILERSGGGPKQPVGRVALFELNDEFYSFSNFTSVIRVSERNRVLPRFLWYYLFHLYSSGVTEALQNHTSGIRNLDFGSYVMLNIPAPTLNEQRRVVEQLDWSIEQANNLLSYVAEQALTLASLRTSLLDAAFSGEI